MSICSSSRAWESIVCCTQTDLWSRNRNCTLSRQAEKSYLSFLRKWEWRGSLGNRKHNSTGRLGKCKQALSTQQCFKLAGDLCSLRFCKQTALVNLLMAAINCDLLLTCLCTLDSSVTHCSRFCCQDDSLDIPDSPDTWRHPDTEDSSIPACHNVRVRGDGRRVRHLSEPWILSGVRRG